MRMKVLILVLAIGLMLAVAELGLWVLEPPAHPEAVTDGHFVRRSGELGWEGKPNAQGHYASGYCFGRIDLDENGVRLNGNTATTRPDFSNIIVLGDSNTAAFEVDNDQTFPALLEQGLRAQGMKANVLNLGVRGYGTDQSVKRALLFAEEFQPEQVVYMYTDNDFFDNNVLRAIYPRFGKGVYWRRGEKFEALNYPVPEYGNGYYGAIVLGPQGMPVLYEGVHPADGMERPLGRLAGSWRLYRKLTDLRGNRVDQKARRWKSRRADPFILLNTDGVDAEDVLFALFFGLIDGGRVRADHGEYYDEQFEYLVRRLWGIPNLRRIHLVEFPNIPTMETLADGEESSNLILFRDLVDRGVVDRFVSLSSEMHDQGVGYSSFTCRGGDHFNNTGHRWIADVLLERLDFDPDDADSEPELWEQAPGTY